MPRFVPDNMNSLRPRWLLAIAIIFFVLLLAAGAGLIVYDSLFKDKIYPNIYIGNFNLGGQSAAEAKRLIGQTVDKINQRGIIFSYKNYQTAVTPVIASADGDLAYQIIGFNIDPAIAAALNFGRGDNFFSNLKNKLLALAVKKQLTLAVFINREEITKILKNNFAETYEPAQDAKLIIERSPLSNDYEFTVAKEKFGKTIDYASVIDRLTVKLSNLDSTGLMLSTITQYPKIFSKDCLNIESQARKFLALAPLILKYGDNQWIISQEQLSQFLILQLNNSDNAGPAPVSQESQSADKIIVGLDDDKFKAYLAEQIASKIDQAPLEAKFEVKDGRVAEFQNSQDGLELDLAASLLKIKNEITATSSIELVVKPRPALVSAGNINSFGIKEIIGVGTSDFSGSPVNRRHNIKVGADSINGLLVKPGEEFSLLKALGKVDGSTGYLPELVIKENKTTPEFGGGLCQVGTTMFRAVIESGLPVTLRRNHSYRVQYYEPAGTDATIYDPWPDFRFLNDLPTYILIQAKVATNTLAFEFWGTRDGRLMEKTKPTIYNIVKPEPTKIIETLDLKPGEKKCTEHAHNGADAYFDYKVTYPDGIIKEKRFSSHYVPWQEVCLLGVESLPPPANGSPSAASSTPATPETTSATN